MRTLLSVILMICVTCVSAANAQEKDELLKAILDGEEQKVATLVNQAADIEKTDTSGMTYLMHACQKGNSQIVMMLLNRGANVRTLSSDGQSPLHYAVNGGNRETVDALLARGADPNIRSASGRSPSDLAYQKGLMEIASVLSSAAAASAYGNGYGDLQSDGRTYVNMLIQDPNKIATLIAKDSGLTKLMTDMKKTEASEKNAWLSRRTDSKTRLMSALEKQVTLEITAICDAAKMAKATNTYADANEYASYFARKMEYLDTRTKEQRRIELRSRATTTSARSSRGSRGSTRGPTSAPMMPSVMPMQNEPPQNNEFADLDSSWTSTTNSTDFWDLCLSENDKILDEYGMLYNSADQEKADKVKELISAIIMSRYNRLMEIQDATEKRRIREANTMQINPANTTTTGRRTRR